MRAKFLLLAEKPAYREELRWAQELLSELAVAFSHSFLMREVVLQDREAELAALVQEHSDIVLFANYRISTVKADVGFNKKVSRAVGSGERVIHTTERPAFLAKNRYGLPDTLPLDWQAFAQAMPEAIQPLLMTAPVAPHANNA